MIKACIFDVDGTLVDSVDAHATTWVRAFAAFGHSVEFQAVRDQIGKGGDQLMPAFLSATDIERDGNAIEQYRAHLLRREYLASIQAFPKVRDLFLRLQLAGIAVVLASSAKGEELQAYKEKVDIVGLVKSETSSDDVKRSKPYGDIFRAALDHLPGINVSDALVVGDTPYDAEAAAKVGLKTIGVRCGGSSDRDLFEAGCVAIYDDPADLLIHFDQLVSSDFA